MNIKELKINSVGTKKIWSLWRGGLLSEVVVRRGSIVSVIFRLKGNDNFGSFGHFFLEPVEIFEI